MRKTKIIAVVYSLVLSLSLASCSWWMTTPIEPDRLPDELDVSDNHSTDPADYFTDMTGLPDVNNSSAMARLGDNLQFFHSTTGDCVIVYNDENAWALDYKLQEITPLVDYDAMLAAADPIGRGAKYFEDVTLSAVECTMNNDYQIMITFTVTSLTHDAYYKVRVFYALNSLFADRGTVGEYFSADEIEYPGSDEPIVINDVAEWGTLEGAESGYEERWIYRLTKALVTLDIGTLEERMNLQSGTLDDWQSVKIGKYSIIRENPASVYFDSVTVIIDITESALERYPAGKYRVTLSDGPGQSFIMIPVDAVPNMHNPSKAELFVREWVSHFGGWYPPTSQTLENSSYAHEIIDFYLVLCYREDKEITYEGFIDFCEERFGYTNVETYVKRDDVEKHGGHGAATVLCEVVYEASATNSHIFEVTFFADPLGSVISRVHRVTVHTDSEDDFAITNVECIRDEGRRVDGWSM